eukprot:3936773-Rhodomonas_salina.1
MEQMVDRSCDQPTGCWLLAARYQTDAIRGARCQVPFIRGICTRMWELCNARHHPDTTAAPSTPNPSTDPTVYMGGYQGAKGGAKSNFKPIARAPDASGLREGGLRYHSTLKSKTRSKHSC